MFCFILKVVLRVRVVCLEIMKVIDVDVIFFGLYIIIILKIVIVRNWNVLFIDLWKVIEIYVVSCLCCLIGN